MLRPELNRVWASGDESQVIDPGDTKYQEGWEAEIPTYQVLNFLQNKVDRMLLALGERGMFEWGSDINYFAGALTWNEVDGKVYVSKIDNPNVNLPPNQNLEQWEPSAVQLSAVDFYNLRAALDTHMASLGGTNPHQLRPQDVGTYSREEIDAMVGEGQVVIDDHLADHNNPHATTAVQAGGVDATAGGEYTGTVTMGSGVTNLDADGISTIESTLDFLGILVNGSGLGINSDGVVGTVTDGTFNALQARTYVGETAPVNAAVNTFWFCTANGVSYVLYDDGDSVQWVDASAGGSIVTSSGSTTGDFVASINGELPDENGNIELTPDDVGALAVEDYTPLTTSLISVPTPKGTDVPLAVGDWCWVNNGHPDAPPGISENYYIEYKQLAKGNYNSLYQTAVGFIYNNSTLTPEQWYRIWRTNSGWTSWIKQYDVRNPPTIEEIPGLREELDAGGSGGNTTYISETPPADATPGSSWYCTANGLTYILYGDGTSTQWVESNPNYPVATGFFTPEDISAAPVDHTHTAVDVGAATITDINTQTLQGTGHHIPDGNSVQGWFAGNPKAVYARAGAGVTDTPPGWNYGPFHYHSHGETDTGTARYGVLLAFPIGSGSIWMNSINEGVWGGWVQVGAGVLLDAAEMVAEAKAKTTEELMGHIKILSAQVSQLNREIKELKGII